MLLGVFVLGPSLMEIGPTLREGGYSNFDVTFLRFLIIASLFPPLTFELSAYNGSIFGLIFTVLGTLVLYSRTRRRQETS